MNTCITSILYIHVAIVCIATPCTTGVLGATQYYGGIIARLWNVELQITILNDVVSVLFHSNILVIFLKMFLVIITQSWFNLKSFLCANTWKQNYNYNLT